MVLIDSMIFVSGITSPDSAPYDYAKSYLSAFDLLGNSIYNSIYHGNDTLYVGTWYNALIKSSENYFINCGYTNVLGVGYNKAMLMKHDDSLNMEFFKEYNRPNGVDGFSLYDVIETDSGFIGLGNYFYPGTNINIMLLKVDSLGNETSRQTVGTSSLQEYALTMLSGSDGYIYIVGIKGIFTSQDESELVTNTYILKADSNLNIVDSWVDPNEGGYFPYSVIESSDSTITWCGTYADETIYAGANYYGFNPMGEIRTIRKDDFTTVWQLHFGYEWLFTHLNEIEQLPDKSFIAVGETLGFATLNVNGDTAYTWAGWMVKVSEQGDLLWDRKYAGVYTNYCENHLDDFELLPDGGIIACGEANSNLTADTFPQQGWLIRLDSCGCLVPGCEFVGIEEPPTEEEIEFVKVFPNPMEDWLYIYFNVPQSYDPKEFSFTIMNMNGEILDYQPQLDYGSTYFLHTAGYASGVYLVNLMRNGEVVQVEKFVKE